MENIFTPASIDELSSNILMLNKNKKRFVTVYEYKNNKDKEGYEVQKGRQEKIEGCA